MPASIESLRQKFKVPGFTIQAGQGGLPRVNLSTPAADAHVYLHGAHVTHWQPKDESPVLWMSGKSVFAPAKPIRGGVPICFPWFGPRAGHPESPAHGFARLTEWELESVTPQPDALTLTLRLDSTDATRAIWPYDFTARHIISVGSTLTLSLQVTNRSAAPFTFEEALHTYFAVDDIRECRVTGLEKTDYLDKVGPVSRKNQGADPISIIAETDRVYLGTTAETTLEDPRQHRRICVAKNNSRATVVWNPWIDKAKAMPDFGDAEWPGMICIETCNVGDYAVALAPKQTHTMTAIIRTELAP